MPRPPLAFRVLGPVLTGAFLLAAALLALGVPDLGSARTFLAGGYPTAAGMAATLDGLLWALISAALAVALTLLLREAAACVRRASANRALAAIVLVVGALTFAGGALAYSQHAGATISGGSAQEAHDAISRLGAPGS